VLPRRFLVLAAGLVLVCAAVLVLREDSDPDDGPVSRVVEPFRAANAVVPTAGQPPDPLDRLTVRPGDGRLQVLWHESDEAPRGAVGYEVRWGRDGGPWEGPRLVTQPGVQLDGLENGVPHRVEVRTVDSFGQRSTPTTATGIPQAEPAPTRAALYDGFTGPRAPDPERWRVVGQDWCPHAVSGEETHRGRLLITANCGVEPLVLRSRALLHLRERDGVRSGAVSVVTDHPGYDGELTIDLVPGPADLVDSHQQPPVGEPGAEPVVNQSLPPGTVRARIVATAGTVTPFIEVASNGLLPTRPAPEAQHATGATASRPDLPPGLTGVTHRWTLQLDASGVHLTVDGGPPVATAPVRPEWTEATVLVGFAGPSGRQLRATLDEVSFEGAPTAPPPLLNPPEVTVEGPYPPDAQLPQLAGQEPLPGVAGGQLRLTLLPRGVLDLAELQVQVGARRFPVRSAVPGTPVFSGIRHPVVVDLPAEALTVSEPGAALRAALIHPHPSTVQVVTADVELTGTPGAGAPARDPAPALQLPPPRVAHPAAELLDASGQEIPVGRTVPRGRVVLQVELDGNSAQAESGQLAGLAGVEVWVDNERVAALPTTAGGPGVAGRWRFGLDVSALAAGPHTVEVRAIPTDPSVLTATTFTSFLLGS